MRRRTFLTAGAVAATAGLAGCSAVDVEDGGETTGSSDEDETLVVGTYESFVDAPSDSPGEWIKDEFEARHDVELEWQTPDQELTYYVERINDGQEIEPELYLGVRPQNLVQADENADEELFTETDESACCTCGSAYTRTTTCVRGWVQPANGSARHSDSRAQASRQAESFMVTSLYGPRRTCTTSPAG